MCIYIVIYRTPDMRHGASFYPVLRQKQIRKHITSRVSGRASKTPEAAAVAEQCGRWPGRALSGLAAAGRSRSRGNSANSNSPLPGLLAPLCVGGGDTDTVAAAADAVAGLSRCHGRLPQRGLLVLPLFSSAVAAAAAVGAVATVTDRDLAPSAPPPGAPRAGCAAHPPRALVCCLPASCGPKKTKKRRSARRSARRLRFRPPKKPCTCMSCPPVHRCGGHVRQAFLFLPFLFPSGLPAALVFFFFPHQRAEGEKN